ncbi:MAG TPA: Crp/Fnr family transcriptional regulator [Sandaracinaceae bacterium]
MPPAPPTTREEFARLLACTRLFRGLDAARARALAEHASVHRLRQGAPLWREGQRAEHFHVVLRGVLELQRVVPGADTNLVAWFGPGESPGVPAALERARYVATSYAAAPIVEVLRVRAEPVLEALPSDPALAFAMNRALLDHCRLLHAKIDVLAAGTVPRRLAALFVDLAERFGDEMEDGSTFVPLVLSRAQIATYVGARVETVIRCCTGWDRAGLLAKRTNGFAIPCLTALEAIARGDDGALEACRVTCLPAPCRDDHAPRPDAIRH